MDLFAVIDALYDSEINCGLQTFWDGGITVWLGDEMNGRPSEAGFSRHNMDRAAEWLRNAAIARFPNSDFAQKYKDAA